MKVNINKIKGVKTFKVDIFEDQRGFFLRLTRKKTILKLTFFKTIYL